RPPPSTLLPYTTLFRSIRGTNNPWSRIRPRATTSPASYAGRNPSTARWGGPTHRATCYLNQVLERRESQTKTSTLSVLSENFSRSEEHTSELQSRFDLV